MFGLLYEFWPYYILGMNLLQHTTLIFPYSEFKKGILINQLFIPGSKREFLSIKSNALSFLATCIPIAMSIGVSTGLNPIVCGLLVMIAGDSVLYYPAQAASSLVIYERGYLTAAEIFRFGLLMTFVAFIVVMVIALPYWSIVGEPLLQIVGR